MHGFLAFLLRGDVGDGGFGYDFDDRDGDYYYSPETSARMEMVRRIKGGGATRAAHALADILRPHLKL